MPLTSRSPSKAPLQEKIEEVEDTPDGLDAGDVELRQGDGDGERGGDPTSSLLRTSSSLPLSSSASSKNEGSPLFPTLTEVLECQISSWYPAFASISKNIKSKLGQAEGDGAGADAPTRRRTRTRVTIRTILLDLPTEFVDAYLASQAGTVRLPPGATTSSILRTGRPAERDNDDDSSDNDNDDDWSTSDSDSDSSSSPGRNHRPNNQNGAELPLFAELDKQIRNAIQELGGSVAPKLNWSAPKDATWMNAGSLRCQTPGDVYLLLQASDFVNFDVHHALKDVRCHDTNSKEGSIARFTGFTLALRKWCHLYPSQEFRCFVKDRQLVALSQRHSTSHYPHLSTQKDEIRCALQEFHDRYVAPTFALNVQGEPVVSHYVMDAYVDQRGKAWIVDFNVWGCRTDPLLFTWDELDRMGSAAAEAAASDVEEEVAAATVWPVVRVVETSKQVRHDPLASYRAPIDAVHVAGLGGGPGDLNARTAFEEFAKLCQRPSEIGLDEDDDSSRTTDDELSD